MNDYVKNLDQLSQKRYLEKISIINNLDPYIVKDWKTDNGKLPAICYGDIVNYLVYGVSAYTMEEFRAYKSLEAFNQFACGWVKDIKLKTVRCFIVVLGKVMHSMRLSEQPLLPWIIASTEGTVKSVHCTCKAGRGEACSHVGALLFYTEDVNRQTNQLTVTDKLQCWGIPYFKNVKPDIVENIDFSIPLKKRKTTEGGTTDKKHVPALSTVEFEGFLHSLKGAGYDVPILRLQKDYQVPSSSKTNKDDNGMLKLCKNAEPQQFYL